MIILLTNDDGINAPGLRALFNALQGLGELWVVAPLHERSGVSHAFTPQGPLRVEESVWDGIRVYAVEGNPADAVKIAVRSLLPEKPALVVSGINNGENTGIDLIYSGTVAGAREGAIFGIPALAMSKLSKNYPDFSASAAFARRMSQWILERGLPPGILLNVNVPARPESQIRGVRITHQAASRYEEVVDRQSLGDGVSACDWVDYYKILAEDGHGSDFEAVKAGFISVTPVHHRLTDFDFIPQLERWDWTM
ncbi:MAG: 5'/3'-nucleotidase SurE [Calditrichota bacterium]